MKRVGIFLGLILMLFLISNINVKANSSVDLTSDEYDDYYVNSDLIYDMSDVDNIVPYYYEGEEILIDDYKGKLYRSTLEYSLDNTNHSYYKILEDDPIVNIIPKGLFTKEIDIKIVDGDEYLYVIKTEANTDMDNGTLYYISHVMVLDFDNNIEDDSFIVSNNLIETTVTKLFEYKYITLLKEYDYSAPTFLRDTVLSYNDDGELVFNSYARVDASFDEDYVVIPYFTSSPMTFTEVNDWTIDNIGFIANLMNTNSLNQNDTGYNPNLDDGYFFIGNRVECKTCEIEVKEYTGYKGAITNLLTLSDEAGGDFLSKYPIFSVLNVISKTYNIPKSICNIISCFDNEKIIYTEYDTSESFTSGTNYNYSTKESQLNNYGNLLRTAFLYLEPPLTLNGNYVKSMYHYSYDKYNQPTIFSELISFNINIGENAYSVVHTNLKNIGVKEVNSTTTSFISDEYNFIGGKAIYNITPLYSQNYSINCGDNDVIIYDDNLNIISTSKNCYLEKSKTYSIYVVNNTDEVVIYDFYIAGYDIEENININSLESIQFTMVSNIDGVRFISSNYDIEDNDLIYFKEGNVYQIIVKNNTSTNGIAELNINEVDTATLDDEGHILNNSKYVRFNEDSGIYKIEYNSVNKHYITADKTLSIRTGEYVKYGLNDEIYFITSYVECITLANYDYNIIFNDNVVEDNSVNYTIDKVNYLYLESTDNSELNVKIEDAVYDTFEDHFEPYYSTLSFDDNYGYYCVLISYKILNGETILFYDTTRIYLYYLPNYSRVILNEVTTSERTKDYSFSFDGALSYIGFNIIAEGELIEYYSSGLKYYFTEHIYSYDALEYVFYFELIYLSDDEVLNSIPFIFENGKDSGCIMSEYQDCVIKVRTSLFDMIQDKYGVIYGISRYDQLKIALLFGEYSSFSYSDYVNDDIEIYGFINDKRFRLLKNISCSSTLEISSLIIFNGDFDGCGYTISGLNVKINYLGYTKGIFSSNYGYIHDVRFSDCTFIIGEVHKWYSYAGFLTANNYGCIENVIVSGFYEYTLNGRDLTNPLTTVNAIYFY